MAKIEVDGSDRVFVTDGIGGRHAGRVVGHSGRVVGHTGSTQAW
jgi:hypothetical protein